VFIGPFSSLNKDFVKDDLISVILFFLSWNSSQLRIEDWSIKRKFSWRRLVEGWVEGCVEGWDTHDSSITLQILKQKCPISLDRTGLS